MAARFLRWRRDEYGHQIRQEISDMDAVWQYFLDHARPFEGGGFLFSMPLLKDKEDLMRRIEVRKKGKYRYTEEEVKNHKPIPKKPKKKTGWRKWLRRLLHNLALKI